MALIDDILNQQGARPAVGRSQGATSIDDILGGGQPAPTQGAPIQQEVAQAEAPLEQQAPNVDPNTWGSIIGRNVDQLQANAGGTLEAIGEATGSQFLTDAGKGIREEQLEQAQEYGDPTHTSYKDVDLEDIGSVGQYLKNTVGGAAPALTVQLGAMGAGAAAGRAAGAIGGPVGQGLGAILGGGLASMGINIGALQNEMKRIDPDVKSPWTAILGGTGMAALDVVGLKGIAAPLVRTLGRDAAYSAFLQAGVTKGLALEAVKGAAIEGGTSAAQSVIQDVGAAIGTDTAVNPEKLVENAINSAIGGGLVGGGIRGGGHILDTMVQNQTVAGSARQGSVFADGSTAEPGMMAKLWNSSAGSAIDALNPIARTSKSGEEFVRTFRPDTTGEKATGKTIFEDTEIKAGQWKTKIEEATQGMKDKDIADLYDKVSDPSYTPTGKEKAFRDALNEIPATGRKAGLDIGDVKNYMPFHLDEARMTNPALDWISKITPYFKDRAAAEKATETYLDRIARGNQGDATPAADRTVSINPATGKVDIKPQFSVKGDPDTMRSRMNQGKGAPEFGQLEMARAFGAVPQKVLNEFIKEQSVKDKAHAINDYVEGAAHRIAYAERFGANNEKANAMIAKTIAESQATGKIVRQADVDRMYNILDAYNGMYGRIKSERLRSLNAVASTAATVITLPFAALSTFTEFLTPAIRGDIGSALQGLAPAFAEIARSAAGTLLKGVPKSDFAKVVSEANLGLEAATSVASARLGATMYNRTAAKINRLFFMANGVSYITHFNRIYSAKVADIIFEKNLYALANGLPITSAKGAQMANQLRSMGVDVKSAADAMALYAPQGPTMTLKAREARTLAMKRFTNQSVLEPNLADTPLWMNNGHLQFLAMLKRYPTAFTNTILPLLARKANPAFAGSFTNATVGATASLFLLGSMIGVGYIQDELKQIRKSGEINYDDARSEGERLRDVVMQTVTPMQFQYVTDMAFANKYGMDPTSVVLGPALGTVNDFGKKVVAPTIASFSDDPTSGYVWKFLYKKSPFRDIESGQEWIDDTFDLPTK